jgi:hypothetical protein
LVTTLTADLNVAKAEAEFFATQRDEFKHENETLLAELDSAKNYSNNITAERNAATAELERLEIEDQNDLSGVLAERDDTQRPFDGTQSGPVVCGISGMRKQKSPDNQPGGHIVPDQATVRPGTLSKAMRWHVHDFTAFLAPKAQRLASGEACPD